MPDSGVDGLKIGKEITLMQGKKTLKNECFDEVTHLISNKNRKKNSMRKVSMDERSENAEGD